MNVETSRVHAHCVLRTCGLGGKHKANYLLRPFLERQSSPQNRYEGLVEVRQSIRFASSGQRGDAVHNAQRMCKSYTEAEPRKGLDLLTDERKLPRHWIQSAQV